MTRHILRVAVLITVVLALGPASLAAGSSPPGATAQCRDGTYSFSQHHSGTCSGHGGVARWLDGASGGTSVGGTADGSGATGSPAGSTAVGSTVLLARRTKTSDCKLGSNPDRRCSPGAYYSKLTKSVICSPGFRTGSVRNVPQSEKFMDETEYGIAPAHYGRSLEIDHIVSLELGGSNDIANLFPEKANPRPGYHAKDKLENTLHTLVCAGRIGLRTAQRGIASNWEALYKNVFGVAPTA